MQLMSTGITGGKSQLEHALTNLTASMQPKLQALSANMQAEVLAGQALFTGATSPSSQVIDNSITKAPVFNINGAVNLQNQGDTEQTLQQLRFLAGY